MGLFFAGLGTSSRTDCRVDNYSMCAMINCHNENAPLQDGQSHSILREQISDMSIKSQELFNLAVVFLFRDETGVGRLTVDVLRSWGLTEIQMAPDALALRDTTNRIGLKLQPQRLEVEWSAPIQVTPEEVATYCNRIIDRLDRVVISAVGTNYSGRAIADGVVDSGIWIRDGFLAKREKLEKAFGKPVFAASTRFFWGDTAKYSDLRLSLIELGKPEMHFQFHIHEANEAGLAEFPQVLIARLVGEKDTAQKTLDVVINAGT